MKTNITRSTILFAGIFSFAISSMAQTQPGKDWYQKPVKDSMGIDLFHAYELLNGKQAHDIVVAVIDGGTDISHPDLKANIWHNPGEIPGNNIDDDHNGYVDDTAGWNFIGGPTGEMVEYDNLEKTRRLKTLMDEFGEVETLPEGATEAQQKRFAEYVNLKTTIENSKEQYEKYLPFYEGLKHFMDDVASKATDENHVTLAEVENFPTSGDKATGYKNIVLSSMKTGRSFESLFKEAKEGYEQIYAMAKYHYNIYYDSRKIVGDHYNNSGERYYGNNDVAGPDAAHGTHVAGIIGAMRDNNYGINGVANHVKIMVVRVVPNGDERDKDVANGIRYAVDNGAKIINMSFGKSYRFNKAVVDSAVRYAVSKGVLLVHAAGNDGENLDVSPNYPNDSLGNNQFAESWIEIGASTPTVKKLAADFSNYSKHNVDVFAPGFQIYSTVPDEGFEFFDGTSMAAPVTSGVAALVWSYYPSLTAVQLKEVLMKSAVVDKKKVVRPGSKKKVKFTKLSVTGGVVNAYNALVLAGKMTTR